MSLTRRRTINIPKTRYIIDVSTHPKTIAMLLDKGICKSNEGVTQKELEAVTSAKLGTIKDYDINGENLDWLYYLYNVFNITYSFAFKLWNFNNIKSYRLPKNIQKIENDAFRGVCTTNKILDIPASLTNIGQRAIYQNYGSSNYFYIFRRNSPITIYASSLTRVGRIYVPDDSVELYKQSWGNITFDETNDIARNLIKPISELNQ